VLLNFGDVGWGEVGASLAGEIFPFPPSLAERFDFDFPFFLVDVVQQ
jgi:hypothetical protein